MEGSEGPTAADGSAGQEGRLGDAVESAVRVKAYAHFLKTGTLLDHTSMRQVASDAEYLGGIIGGCPSVCAVMGRKF